MKLNPNTIKQWFFSHTYNNIPNVTLPHCPCNHKHTNIKQAVNCARNRKGIKGTHVREVINGKAVADHKI